MTAPQIVTGVTAIRQAFAVTTFTALYSTPNRESFSYLVLVAYCAGTTIAWQQHAFWAWLTGTIVLFGVLTMIGSRWARHDSLPRPGRRE